MRCGECGADGALYGSRALEGPRCDVADAWACEARQRIAGRLASAEPDALAIIERILGGGPQAVKDVREALRERAAAICTDDGTADERRAASERYVRLLELAGEEG